MFSFDELRIARNIFDKLLLDTSDSICSRNRNCIAGQKCYYVTNYKVIKIPALDGEAQYLVHIHSFVHGLHRMVLFVVLKFVVLSHYIFNAYLCNWRITESNHLYDQSHESVEGDAAVFPSMFYGMLF